MSIRNLTLLLALGTLSVAWAPAALPQVTSNNDSSPAASQPSSAYSDAELKSFAAAAIAVQAIRDMYVLKMTGANGQSEQQQLKQAAVQEMAAAVEQQGLSVGKFQEILVNAQGDPGLVDKI